jgi:C4-dicarboxylate-specific signal transduction histidine kinase
LARRAADIIQRIRTMAVPGDAGRIPLAMNTLLEESMMFLRPELARHDVEAELDLAPGLPEVSADRVQIQQVFVNLAVNAIQAMASRLPRRLVIRTSRPRTRWISDSRRTGKAWWSRLSRAGIDWVNIRFSGAPVLTGFS